MWLAERVAGWGRVYVVEALCRQGVTSSPAWLLRHACDSDYLNDYFAARLPPQRTCTRQSPAPMSTTTWSITPADYS